MIPLVKFYCGERDEPLKITGVHANGITWTAPPLTPPFGCREDSEIVIRKDAGMVSIFVRDRPKPPEPPWFPQFLIRLFVWW